MPDTIAQPKHVPAGELTPGVRVVAGFLPLKSAAEILFAYPYVLFGEDRMTFVYLYDGDGQPQADDLLAESLIPVEKFPCTCPGPPIFTDGCKEHDRPKPTAVCLYDLPGQTPAVACPAFPLCDCTPPAHWVR